MDLTMERISRALADKKISQKQFMADLGLATATFTEWKAGRLKSYKKHIDRIADYLDVSTEYLLGRSDDPNPRPEDAVIVRGDFVGPVSSEEKAWLESVLDAYRARKE